MTPQYQVRDQSQRVSAKKIVSVNLCTSLTVEMTRLAALCCQRGQWAQWAVWKYLDERSLHYNARYSLCTVTWVARAKINYQNLESCANLVLAELHTR